MSTTSTDTERFELTAKGERALVTRIVFNQAMHQQLRHILQAHEKECAARREVDDATRFSAMAIRLNLTEVDADRAQAQLAAAQRALVAAGHTLDAVLVEFTDALYDTVYQEQAS